MKLECRSICSTAMLGVYVHIRKGPLKVEMVYLLEAYPKGSGVDPGSQGWIQGVRAGSRGSGWIQEVRVDPGDQGWIQGIRGGSKGVRVDPGDQGWIQGDQGWIQGDRGGSRGSGVDPEGSGVDPGGSGVDPGGSGVDAGGSGVDAGVLTTCTLLVWIFSVLFSNI